jgi:hypothetical protein
MLSQQFTRAVSRTPVYVLSTPASVATVSGRGAPAEASLVLRPDSNGDTVDRYLPRTLQTCSFAVKRGLVTFKRPESPIVPGRPVTAGKTSGRTNRPTLGAIASRIAGVLSPRRRPFATS